MLCYESSYGPSDKEDRLEQALRLTLDHLTDSPLHFVYPDGYLLTLTWIQTDQEGNGEYLKAWSYVTYPSTERCSSKANGRQWNHDFALRHLTSCIDRTKLPSKTIEEAQQLFQLGWTKLIEYDYRGDKK